MRYVAFGIVALILVFILEPMNSWVLMWLFYLVAALVLVALRVTDRPATLLESNRRLSRAYAQVGQPVNVDVSVRWSSARGNGWVMVQDTVPPEIRQLTTCGQLQTLGGETATTFNYQIAGQKRGYYAIGPMKLTVGDLFGLAESSATSQDTQYLTIYPRIVPVPELRLPSNRPIGDAPSAKRLYEDPTRITGVREYAPGDTLSKIHWKSTARTGTLMTKQCEPSTSVEVNILLNLHYGDYPPDRDAEVELACTAAASVATALLAEKNLVGLQSNGYDPIWQFEPAKTYGTMLRPDKGEHQMTAILGSLGRLQRSEKPPLADYFRYIRTNLPWTSSLLLITHALNEEAAVTLEALRHAGFELAVIIAGQGEVAEKSQLRAVSLGIPTALVKTEKALGQLAFWQPGRD